MTALVQRVVHRNRLVAVRITDRELERLHRVAKFAGLTLSDLVREATRSYARELERERCEVDR
jgi:hypothetical protein